ncbi:MAG TPA: hypothetical protein VEQ66_02720 [Propionibacteriaceae bacterium]|nr:hypothetical protein [Propionibacteriaceae bacterium]
MTQQTALTESEPGVAPAPPAGPAVGRQFAGPPLRLDRLSTVRRGTVVVESPAGRPPLLRRPGELLLPAWIPWGAGVTVQVVTTEPVGVRVDVDRLVTLDGQTLALVELDIVVRLVEDKVLALVAEPDLHLDADLRLQVQRTVGARLRVSVGRIHAPDLRQHGLAALLGMRPEERWLPDTVADGTLVVETWSIARLRWSMPDELPAHGDDEDTAPLPRVQPGPPPSTLPQVEEQPPQHRQGPQGSAAPEPSAAPQQDQPAERPPTPVEPILQLGPLGREDRHQWSRSADNALAVVYLPALISVTVWWIFFTAFWLPELQTLPGARFLLEQLAPLASKEVTSGGEALVTGQSGHSGAPAAILLAASLILAPLTRSRYWLARLAIWPVTYVASVAAAVSVLGVLLRGRLLEDLLGVALVVVWVHAAVKTTWHSLWVDIDTLPRRPTDVAWVLGLFTLVATAPVAVGRSLFAPELRLAALGVLGNDAALRWGALLTPATAWVYVSGLLLGVLVWAVYLLWPPRGVRRLALPIGALLGALLALSVIGPQATRAATAQAEAMRTQSPGARLSFTCGFWTRSVPDQPVQTLVISGLGCKQLTSFRGYVETSHREAAISLSPVRALTVTGRRIGGRLVAAQYGDVVVLAATDRLDRRPTALVGLRIGDGRELWRVGCRADRPVRVRFARATGGDDPVGGRQTGRGERALIHLDCAGELRRLDPRTGRRA